MCVVRRPTDFCILESDVSGAVQVEDPEGDINTEYNALSTSLRDVIHLMQLVEEANKLGWNTHEGPPKVHCKVFEDNIGALEMARLPKMRPRTKHLCVRLHHFREHVRKKLITIQHVATDLQIADLLTKPQPSALFVKQRQVLMRWPLSNSICNDDDSDKTTNLIHLRACGISKQVLPDKADEGQSENEISMTEIRDVNTTTSHEEKANKACESTTEAMLSHEVRVPNYQVMESQNSLQLDGQERMESPVEHQKYADGNNTINEEELYFGNVERPYTTVQKRKRKGK